jgi:DNA-binding NarL/FixJ family response regulator
MTGARVRLIVVDDHALVRQGIVALLRMHDDLEVVAETGDADEARALAATHQPDVLLVDLRLGADSGADLIRGLRADGSRARFLVLTTYDGEDDVTRALQAGAHGYLLKGATRTELHDAIEIIARGGRYVPREIALRVLPQPPGSELTDREREVLRHIAGGLDNAEIAAALGISERTVKSHINSLFAKLEVSDRTKALVVAARRGLVRLD